MSEQLADLDLSMRINGTIPLQQEYSTREIGLRLRAAPVKIAILYKSVYRIICTIK
jgi:hypothetical protein